MQAHYEWEMNEVVSVVVRMTKAEAEAYVAAFDEASSTSPTAADSREIARPVVVALKEALT